MTNRRGNPQYRYAKAGVLQEPRRFWVVNGAGLHPVHHPDSQIQISGKGQP